MTMKRIDDDGFSVLSEKATAEQKNRLRKGANELLLKALDEGKDFFIGIREGSDMVLTGHGTPKSMFMMAECLLDKAEEAQRMHQESLGEDNLLETLKQMFGAENVHTLDEFGWDGEKE